MAFTTTIKKIGVMGDIRYAIFSSVATSVTSGSIVTGLQGILHTSLLNKTTAGIGIVDDTTTAGTVAISALTSGDTVEVMVWGY